MKRTFSYQDIPKEVTVGDYLSSHSYSKGCLTFLKQNQGLSVNGEAAKTNTLMQPGDTLTVVFDEKEDNKYYQDQISSIASSLVNLNEYCDEKYMRDVEKTEENIGWQLADRMTCLMCPREAVGDARMGEAARQAGGSGTKSSKNWPEKRSHSPSSHALRSFEGRACSAAR